MTILPSRIPPANAKNDTLILFVMMRDEANGRCSEGSQLCPARWRSLAYLALARPVRAAVELLRGRPRLAWAGLRGTIDGFFPETRA